MSERLSNERFSPRQWLAEWWETLRVAPPFSRRRRELLAVLRDTDPANWVEVEAERAAERWREHNRVAREAGCKCGAPATHVRYGYGTVGGVPAEVWTCAAHINVNGWIGVGDGPWRPMEDFTPNELAWTSDPIFRGDESEADR